MCKQQFARECAGCKPDLCFRKLRKVIFVRGCFWHGHKCKQVRHPSTNVEYWDGKIAGNLRRDKNVKAALTKLGWKYLVIWECQLRNPSKVASQIVPFLT